MIVSEPRTLPKSGSIHRPEEVVGFMRSAASSAFGTDESTAWPARLIRACNEVEVQAEARKFLAQSADVYWDIAEAGELLGMMVCRIASPSQRYELCRDAYPGLWDLALDQYAADPELPGEPDPILYDHDISLDSILDTDEPWPTGLDFATISVMKFTHKIGWLSSTGLGLAHVVPHSVGWPPPEAPPELLSARQALLAGLDNVPVSLAEHTARLHSYIAARHDPDLPDPTTAERDQVAAAVRDWDDHVIPAAVDLATATYSHAWEWASRDPDCWGVGAAGYAHIEAYLSIYHLAKATDAFDLADVAARGHAWWWCYDRNLDIASLREMADTW